MKELSKEVIELIEKESHVCFKEEHKPIFKAGMRTAFKPSILEAANLVSKEDALGFAEWIGRTGARTYDEETKRWNVLFREDTTPELFEIYLNQKTPNP